MFSGEFDNQAEHSMDDDCGESGLTFASVRGITGVRNADIISDIILMDITREELRLAWRFYNARHIHRALMTSRVLRVYRYLCGIRIEPNE